MAYSVMTLRWVMVVSAALRLTLVVFGEWQDAHLEVRYTDIDYLVFSDAAASIAAGGSPFAHATYRCSPLLAILLLPNSLLHPAWGKLLFSAAARRYPTAHTLQSWSCDENSDNLRYEDGVVDYRAGVD